MARLHFVQKARGNSKSEDGGRGCGKCGARIMPGDGYYWWANRLPGSRSGTRNNRCANCHPTLAEMTPGRAGQIMQIQEDVSNNLAGMEETKEVSEYETAAAEAAAQIEELADEIREAGENMESGFEHPTEQSENLINCADEIAEKASDLEGISFDEPPENAPCEECAGNGEIDNPDYDPDDDENEEDESIECPECGGSGEGDEPDGDAMQTWRDDCAQLIEDIVNEVELTY